MDIISDQFCRQLGQAVAWLFSRFANWGGGNREEGDGKRLAQRKEDYLIMAQKS